jgi:hypothetical protein
MSVQLSRRMRGTGLEVLLGLICAGCCGSSAQSSSAVGTDLVNEQTPTSRSGVALVIRAVPDPRDEVAGRRSLEVKLMVVPSSPQAVWVNGRLSPSPGEISVTIVDEHGARVPDKCNRNIASPEPSDYLILGPGDSIARIHTFDCYDFSRLQSVSITVQFRDAYSKAPPSPIPAAAQHFRGPVSSNTITLDLR